MLNILKLWWVPPYIWGIIAVGEWVLFGEKFYSQDEHILYGALPFFIGIAGGIPYVLESKKFSFYEKQNALYFQMLIMAILVALACIGESLK